MTQDLVRCLSFPLIICTKGCAETAECLRTFLLFSPKNGKWEHMLPLCVKEDYTWGMQKATREEEEDETFPEFLD